MKKIDIFFILFGFLLGFLCFLSTTKILFGSLILILFVVDYFLLIRKDFKRYFSLIERVHTSYHFINSFVVTMSVKESYEEAYKNAIRIKNYELNAQTKELNDLAPLDRVRYLKDYFNLAIYKMFINVIDLYVDQGGNIISLSDNLIKECTRTEKTLSETLSIGYKHLAEFITLWTLSFGILIFIKFSIQDFYSQMLQNPMISPLIMVFFLICIISINLFVKGFTNLTIKEDQQNEKA